MRTIICAALTAGITHAAMAQTADLTKIEIPAHSHFDMNGFSFVNGTDRTLFILPHKNDFTILSEEIDKNDPHLTSH